MAENTDRDTALILATNMLKEIGEEPKSSERDAKLRMLAQKVTYLTEAA